MMVYPDNLTATELLICKVLSSGQKHTFEELHSSCISDDLSSFKNLQVHVCNLRKKFKPIGMKISFVTNNQGKNCYQLLRSLNMSETSE